jgi:CubicO group peptidase (beta-lactamase class C family)
MTRCGALCGLFIPLLAIGVAYFHTRLVRLYNVNSLFYEDRIASNFRSTHTVGFPFKTVSTRGSKVAQLDEPPNGVHGLPESFLFNGTSINLPDWLEEHWTTGMVALKVDGVTKARLLHEQYSHGNDAASRCVSWSMCKSIISTMIGVAVDRGIIGNIETATVTDYVPELKGSGYDGVRLKDVLQMSSGVAFNEDYFDPFSDINIMGYTLALGGSMDSFVARLRREHPPGTFNHYVSIDTQVLGMVLSRAAKQPLADFLEEHLWSKVGFESSATWCMDNDRDRTELAFGVLGVTTRDYARFGWMMLNDGLSPATGQRIVAKEWVRAATTPDAPHLMPGDANTQSDYPFFGYGYQWWVGPREDDLSAPADDFLAIGVYGQMIYVSREHNVVIAKNAAYPGYDQKQRPGTHENYVETQGFHALRAIAKHLGRA